jgi:hypothetical protein
VIDRRFAHAYEHAGKRPQARHARR